MSEIGCGNHTCWIEKPTGQATNGGCTCLRPLERENVAVAIEVKKKLALNKALTNERDLLKKALKGKILDKSGVKACKEIGCNLRTCGSDECIKLHIAREQEGE